MRVFNDPVERCAYADRNQIRWHVAGDKFRQPGKLDCGLGEDVGIGLAELHACLRCVCFQALPGRGLGMEKQVIGPDAGRGEHGAKDSH